MEIIFGASNVSLFSQRWGLVARLFFSLKLKKETQVNIGTQGVQELLFCESKVPGGSRTPWTLNNYRSNCTSFTYTGPGKAISELPRASFSKRVLVLIFSYVKTNSTPKHFNLIFKTLRAFSLVDRCAVQMRVCKHGCHVTLSLFPQHNLKPFQSQQSNSQVQVLRNSD